MRKIGYRLYNFPIQLVLHLIEQQRKDNGGNESEKQIVQIDQQRISNQLIEIRIGQKLFKVLKAYPGASPNSFLCTELFESDERSYIGIYLKRM